MYILALVINENPLDLRGNGRYFLRQMKMDFLFDKEIWRIVENVTSQTIIRNTLNLEIVEQF